MSKVNIFINGESMQVKSDITVMDLIKELDLDISKVAVEKNLEIIDATSFQSHKIIEGDKLEIVHFIGGG